MYNADLDHLYPKDPKIACTLNHLYPWITCTLGVYNSIWLYTYLVYISFTRRDNPHASRAPSFYWSPPFPRNVVQADQIRQAPEQRSLSLQLHRIILRDRANAKARLAGKSGRHFHKFGVYGHEGEMTTWNHTWLEKSCKFDGFGCCFPNWGYKLLYMILCVYIYIYYCMYIVIYIYGQHPHQDLPIPFVDIFFRPFWGNGFPYFSPPFAGDVGWGLQSAWLVHLAAP